MAEEEPAVRPRTCVPTAGAVAATGTPWPSPAAAAVAATCMTHGNHRCNYLSPCLYTEATVDPKY